MKTFLPLLFIFFYSAAMAADTPARASFENFRMALDNNDAAMAHTYVAMSGQPLFDRFASYGLLPCLPKDSQFISEQKAGNYQMVVAGLTGLNDKWQIVRLYFSKENAGYAFDMHETLRRGLGEKWQTQVNVIEQLYLLAKAQMGDALTCDVAKKIIKPETVSK